MFHNAEIEKSLEKLDTQLIAFTKKMNNISGDIKNLEEHLNKKNVALAVCVGVDKWTPLTPDEEKAIEASEYAGRKIVPQSWIGWGRDHKSGKMRILHHRVLTIDGLPISSKPSSLKKMRSKPLIEATTEERFRAYKHLPRLLECLSSVVKEEPFPLFES